MSREETLSMYAKLVRDVDNLSDCVQHLENLLDENLNRIKEKELLIDFITYLDDDKIFNIKMGYKQNVVDNYFSEI